MELRLRQALRNLRGIRQRYEIESNTSSASERCYSVQVGLGHADMLWITATIEALEKAVGESAGQVIGR